MPDPHQMTAEAHLSHAERLLLEAAAGAGAYKLALAAAHLDCARTITVMAEAERNRQSRLDAKSQMAGIHDLASKLFRDEELGP